MKKILVTAMLGFAVVAAGQVAQPAQPPQGQPAQGQPAPGQPAQGQPGASPSQAPVIKDPAEYNAYVGAVQQNDPAAKISGLEAFLAQYPNSVMKTQALEILMGTYQQTGNQAKTLDAATKLVQADPNNVRALALLAYLKRTMAQAGQNPQQNLADAKKYGQLGLDALPKFNKPEGTSDTDFQKMKDQMSGIFNAAVGIAALQDKDYATAQKSLKVAADANPQDFSIGYPLALAYLQATPQDSINGIWYGARALAIAPTPQVATQIEPYIKRQYVKYHGADDGWTDLVAKAKASPTMPADFTIKPAPTPADQAADLVKSKDPTKMDFAEWELILTVGKQEDADTVFNAIKGKAVQLGGAKVITSSPAKLTLAASLDDIDANKADVELTMSAPIPARLLPKEGATIDFEGTPETYTKNPFLISMDKGVLLTKKAPAGTPKKKPPVRRKPAAQ
jgi:tetratricopeptide (TPR) repeat protein